MLIGLTGGVASGKTLAAREFKKLGAFVIDADEIARQIIMPPRKAYRGIVKEFGSCITLPDGSIDRKTLGTIVFSNARSLKKLNEITHPPIIKEITRRITALKNRNPSAIIVLNAPLLVEAGLHKKMDKIVVVYADKRRQLERLIRRDGLTKKEALSRINAQMGSKEKLKFADFIIHNNKDKKSAVRETRKIYRKIQEVQKPHPPFP